MGPVEPLFKCAALRSCLSRARVSLLSSLLLLALAGPSPPLSPAPSVDQGEGAEAVCASAEASSGPCRAGIVEEADTTNATASTEAAGSGDATVAAADGTPFSAFNSSEKTTVRERGIGEILEPLSPPDSDRWMNTWFSDPASWSGVGSAFRKGELVQIKSALRTEAAEALWRELVNHTQWSANALHDSEIQFHRHNLECSRVDHHDCPRLLMEFHNHLGALVDKFSQLPLVELAMWPPWPMATWYRPGDYISPHNDILSSPNIGSRAVAFILSLTKGWKPEWGGQFWWFPKHGHTQVAMPDFNTMYLFEPSPSSLHMVAPVTPAAPDPILQGESAQLEARRLTVSGWFTTKDPYLNARVRDKYGYPPAFVRPVLEG